MDSPCHSTPLQVCDRAAYWPQPFSAALLIGKCDSAVVSLAFRIQIGSSTFTDIDYAYDAKIV